MMFVAPPLLPRVVLGKLPLSPRPRKQLDALMSKRSLSQLLQLLHQQLGVALLKPSKKGTLKTQRLRRRQGCCSRRSCCRKSKLADVEEDLVQNVDVEVVEEDREDDPDQVMLMTTAKDDEVGEVDVHVGG